MAGDCCQQAPTARIAQCPNIIKSAAGYSVGSAGRALNRSFAGSMSCTGLAIFSTRFGGGFALDLANLACPSLGGWRNSKNAVSAVLSPPRKAKRPRDHERSGLPARCFIGSLAGTWRGSACHTRAVTPPFRGRLGGRPVVVTRGGGANRHQRLPPSAPRADRAG
jgi:hypothetical protein